MARLNQAFDSNQYEEMGNFDPVPAGIYTARIVKSEIKQNNKKTGSYMKFEFQVLNGEFNGRKFWSILNIQNQSREAVEIAQKELTSICKACKKPIIQDTQELHDIPIKIKVIIKKGDDNWPPKNVPVKYEALGGSTSTPPKTTKKATNSKKIKNKQIDNEAPWGEDDFEDDDIPF
jgi:hypothetical protein